MSPEDIRIHVFPLFPINEFQPNSTHRSEQVGAEHVGHGEERLAATAIQHVELMQEAAERRTVWLNEEGAE